MDRATAKLPTKSEARPAFGLKWMRRYMPHYMSAPPSRLHLDLAHDLAEVQRIRGQKRNYIAPRGSAKTSWISKGFVLHGAVEGIEPLTLLLAETGEQARKYLDSVKEELELNPVIARDYPEACGKGRLWQSERIRLRNGCEIVARGAGGRILGMTRRDKRPTLIVVDDGNQRGDAYSPTTRQRKIDWMVKDVLPAGEPSTNYIVAGTPIHREAIVCYLKAAGWRTRCYDAMYRMPDNNELWRQWGLILTDLSNPKRDEAANEFYEANREAMDAGAELLWPERMTLKMLMEVKELYGEEKYRTEYTSDPGSPLGAEWPAEHFDWHGFWFDQWPEVLRLKVMALDPSKGPGTNFVSGDRDPDYQAHAMVALADNGHIYIDADMRREHPEAMIARTVRLCREWGSQGRPVDRIILEDNGTMGLISGAIQTAVGSEVLPWECLTQTDNKDLRIRVIGPYLSQKRIHIRNTPGGRELVKQLRDFPFGDHDDGPDAVATGIRWMQQAMRRA